MPYNTAYIDLAMESIDFRADLAPDDPTNIFGDGVNYSDNLWWQSPEGNFYGQTTVVKDFAVPIVWDGEKYVDIKPISHSLTIDDLPAAGRRRFEMHTVVKPSINEQDVKNQTLEDVYYWETSDQSWHKIEWYWNIDVPSNVPFPGLHVGAAHIFLRHHQQLVWTGYGWMPFPAHSTLWDDEQDRHLPEGFITNYEGYQTNTNGAIQFLQSELAEARLEFVSKTTLGLFESITGKTGALWVNSELLLTDDVSDVENTDTVLQYSNGTITNDTVDPNTEYYIYCGNSDFTACSSGLFLSLTPDTNGRLGDEEPGWNARIVGVVETDSAGYFVREIDMSYIGKKVEFSQTFWEYADYQLQFVDQDNLAFNRIDGTHGLCYINGQLLNLGTGKDLARDAYRIEWADGPIIDTSDILADTIYQIYIANDSTEYNFNNNDDETGFPYEEGHPSYIWQLDFRRRLFLSTKQHDHRLFDQEYPGYYARHIGQVQTDENAYFKYSSDISLIRQPTLNPTHLDGLAECVIQDVSTTEFKITRKKGTVGLVYVGGRAVNVYDADNPLVHRVQTSDTLYDYTEVEIEEPLSDSGLVVEDKPGVPIYVYLANNEDCWQGITHFCSLETPHSGYLSTNWPGNNARWIATLRLAPSSLGSELVTNGSFTTDSDWTKGDGWSYDAGDQTMLHTPGDTEVLSQDISAIAEDYYAVEFTGSDRTEGSVRPKVGGTFGTTVTTNTSSTQYILATNDGDLEFHPDSAYDGSLDNVSVKKVITGQFSGTYIIDSVAGISASIDDSIISSNTTYSSQKLEAKFQELLAKISAAQTFESQKATGLNLLLEYVDSGTIRLKAIDSDVTLVFPDLSTYIVDTTGITTSVTGSVETLYYIYLNAGGLDILTSAPDNTYDNMQTRGTANILVGYLGCSATDTIAGTQNVYSFWNQPQHTYDQSFTSTADAATFTNCQGLVVPSSVTATVSLVSGTWTGRTVFGGECSFSLDLTTSGITSNSTTGYCTDINSCIGYRQHTISTPTSGALSDGVFDDIVITTTKTVNTYATPVILICSVSSSSWISASYTLRITRPGS